MSGGSYMQKYVLCPFFRRNDEERRRIVCEGVCENSSLEQRFSSAQEYRLQLEVFCCEHYTSCELHEVLMKKYEE